MPVASTDDEQAWNDLGANKACDTSAGETYLGESSGNTASLDKCKESCENEANCKSITYWNGGWCSHFSTDCSKTKAAANGHAMQKVQTWKSVGSNLLCNEGGNGGQMADTLDKCKESCAQADNCKSITYWNSGWCSRFSTDCSNTSSNNYADSAWQLV